MNKRKSFLAMICALALTAGVFHGTAVNAEETGIVIGEEQRIDADQKSSEELEIEEPAAEEAPEPENEEPGENEAAEPEEEIAREAEAQTEPPEASAEKEAQVIRTEGEGKDKAEIDSAPENANEDAKAETVPAEESTEEDLEQILPLSVEINGEKTNISVSSQGIAVLLKAAHEGDVVLKITKAPGLQLTRDGREVIPTEEDEEILTFIIPVKAGESEIILQASREMEVTLAAEWQTKKKAETTAAPAEEENGVLAGKDEPAAENGSDAEFTDDTTAEDPGLIDDAERMDKTIPEKDQSPLAEVLEGISDGAEDGLEAPLIDIVIEEKTEDPAPEAAEQREEKSSGDSGMNAVEEPKEDSPIDPEADVRKEDSPADPSPDAGKQQAEDSQTDPAMDILELQTGSAEELMEGAEEEELVRRVELTSSLDGMNSVPEGTEITLTVELTGLAEDEIAEVVWMYRQEDDPPETYHIVEDAEGLTYTYPISEENARHQWRVMLKLDS